MYKDYTGKLVPFSQATLLKPALY